MISNEDAEVAVDYLRDNARPAAQARAERIYMDEYRKVIKSQIMRENQNLPIGAQEAIAYTDHRYDEHLKAMRTAIEQDECNRWMMVAAEARLEAWRTQQASSRGERKAYS